MKPSDPVSECGFASVRDKLVGLGDYAGAGLLRDACADLAALRTELEQVRADAAEYVKETDARHDELCQQLAEMQADRDRWKQNAADESEADAEIRDLARPYTDVDGDSRCVPTPVDIVESLVGKLAESDLRNSGVLNRRTTVEQWLLDHQDKHPLLRPLALWLGTGDNGKRDECAQTLADGEALTKRLADAYNLLGEIADATDHNPSERIQQINDKAHTMWTALEPLDLNRLVRLAARTAKPDTLQCNVQATVTKRGSTSTATVGPAKPEQEEQEVYCHPCSVAGGAEMPIYHLPPACPAKPEQAPQGGK